MAFKMSGGISDRLLGDCVTVTDSLRCREKGHKWSFISRLRQKHPTVPARRDKTRTESWEGFSHWLIMSHSRTVATKPDRSDKPSISAILIVQCSVNFNSGLVSCVIKATALQQHQMERCRFLLTDAQKETNGAVIEACLMKLFPPFFSVS